VLSANYRRGTWFALNCVLRRYNWLRGWSECALAAANVIDSAATDLIAFVADVSVFVQNAWVDSFISKQHTLPQHDNSISQNWCMLLCGRSCEWGIWIRMPCVCNHFQTKCTCFQSAYQRGDTVGKSKLKSCWFICFFFILKKTSLNKYIATH
jgi:hypothetical protein